MDFLRRLRWLTVKLKEAVKMTKKHYYIEHRENGDYAVTARGASRASAIVENQREAIRLAERLNPHDHPDVERVRHTSRGTPARWRSAKL